MKQRCPWATQSPLEQDYHDQQWGRPTEDDATLFEFLILELMQAGLSWKTILTKQQAFRTHLDQFDYHKIAQYDQDKFNQLMNEHSIIRNRLKLEATINNAQKFIEVQQEFGTFSNYLWAFTDHKVLDYQPETSTEVQTTNQLAKTITKDLKKRGFKFLGPTIIYSYLQAMGLINDHLMDCFVRKELKQ